MAYFNHAFQQAFVPTSFLLSGGEDSSVLTSQEGAFIAEQSYDVANTATLTAGKTNLILAMGSPLGGATGVNSVNDILGGNRFHGGYAESWKSKVINPKYIRFIGKQAPVTAVAAKLEIVAEGDCFPCAGDGPMYRVDLKGAPALRALNRNAYKVLGGDGYCCPAGQTYRDPAKVMADMAVQLLEDPIISQLIDVHVEKDLGAGAGLQDIADSRSGTGTRYEKQQAAVATLRDFVADTTVAAGNKGKITIHDTSSETVFGNCSFDTRDYYSEEPLQILGSQMDENGDPCTATCMATTPTAGKSSETKGELVLRDVMMYERYRQHPTNQGNLDSARIREVERVGPANSGLTLDRTADFTSYYILHTVPRFNNPSGTFDNDQYLIKIYTNGTIVDLETQLNALAVGTFGAGSTMTDMGGTFLPGEGFLPFV